MNSLSFLWHIFSLRQAVRENEIYIAMKEAVTVPTPSSLTQLLFYAAIKLLSSH